MPEKASGTDVAAVTQLQGQQYPLLCPSGSVVVTELHHADLKLLLAPQRWELSKHLQLWFMHWVQLSQVE